MLCAKGVQASPQRNVPVGWRENTVKRGNCDTGINLNLKCIYEGKHKSAGYTITAV